MSIAPYGLWQSVSACHLQTCLCMRSCVALPQFVSTALGTSPSRLPFPSPPPLSPPPPFSALPSVLPLMLFASNMCVAFVHSYFTGLSVVLVLSIAVCIFRARCVVCCVPVCVPVCVFLFLCVLACLRVCRPLFSLSAHALTHSFTHSLPSPTFLSIFPLPPPPRFFPTISSWQRHQCDAAAPSAVQHRARIPPGGAGLMSC